MGWQKNIPMTCNIKTQKKCKKKSIAYVVVNDLLFKINFDNKTNMYIEFQLAILERFQPMMLVANCDINFVIVVKAKKKVKHVFVIVLSLHRPAFSFRCTLQVLTPSKELTQPWCESSPLGDSIKEQPTSHTGLALVLSYPLFCWYQFYTLVWWSKPMI